MDNRILYSDSRTLVVVDQIEELPTLDLLPLHKELVHFTEGSTATDKAVFLKIRIDSDKLGFIVYPVVYAFAENETFFCKKMVPNDAIVSHIIHVRYGGGCGGGGSASGIWLLHVLRQLHCELFITDGHHHWQSGDHFALRTCRAIPRTNTSTLTPIRTIHSQGWSGHGDVSWNLVS